LLGNRPGNRSWRAYALAAASLGLLAFNTISAAFSSKLFCACWAWFHILKLTVMAITSSGMRMDIPVQRAFSLSMTSFCYLSGVQMCTTDCSRFTQDCHKAWSYILSTSIVPDVATAGDRYKMRNASTLMFTEALKSRSWRVPQLGHVHSRSFKSRS
jgi:hypothetical protein